MCSFVGWATIKRCKLRLTVETAMMGGAAHRGEATMIGDLKCIWIMSAYCTKISDEERERETSPLST